MFVLVVILVIKLCQGAYVFLAIFNSRVNQFGVLGFLGGCEDERWVGGGILRLVCGDGCMQSVGRTTGVGRKQYRRTVEIAGVADNSLEGLLAAGLLQSAGND